MSRLNNDYIKWRKKPLKERFSDSVSIWFIVFILFYLIQAVIGIFHKSFPSLVDFFAVISTLTAVFVLHLFFKFKKTVPICLALGSIFHIAGLYKFIPYNPYYIGNLYGAPQLNYHYDWIPHFVGFGFYMVAFLSIMYPYFKKIFKSKFLIFLLSLFFMLGLGATNEIIEYVGYVFFGYGEGFLEFGEGDFSPDSGPWENASRDLICNLTGGVVAAGLFLLVKRYKEPKLRRKPANK